MHILLTMALRWQPPHVSGAYALLLATNPNWTVVEAKNALMESVDLEDALEGKCLTGGRLNIFKASHRSLPVKN